MEPTQDSLSTLQTPDFQLESDKKTPEWLNYLNENGYTVIKNVLSQDEVSTSVDKYW